MSSNPLVSVIIPCYNVENYLKNSLEALLKGSYQNFEAICIDDGSTDNTLSILYSFSSKDPRIKVIHQINKGVSAARNLGIRITKGEFIMFLDPDDIPHSNFINAPIHQMCLKKADYCISNYTIVENDISQMHHPVPDYNLETNNQILNIFFPKIIGVSKDVFMSWASSGTSLNKFHDSGMCWRFCYRADVIKSNNIYFNENITFQEDDMFQCEYMLYSKNMTCVPESTYSYFVRSRGAVHSFNKSSIEKQISTRCELLETRQVLAKKYFKSTGMNCECLYAGSVITGIIHILDNLSQVEKHKDIIYRKVFKLLLMQQTRKEIRMIPLCGRPAIFIVLFLLRIRGYAIIIFFFKLYRFIK